MLAGISMGAALGSLVVAHGGERSLGFVAGACALLALVGLRLAPEMAGTPPAAA
jgi:predicted MFS family arabinose efflux permease